MSTPVPQPVPAPPPETGVNYLQRLINVFFAPTKVFSDLNRKPGWIVPFIILAIFSGFFVWTVDAKIGFDKVAENQMKLNSRAMEQMEKMSPEQRNAQMAITTKITRISSYSFAVFMLIFWLIISGVLLGTFNFGFGQQIRYPVALAVVIYASIPSILKTILATISLFAGIDPDGFHIQNPVATNLGAFIDVNTSKVLYSIGSNLDIFAVWTLILTGIGFAAVSKLKKGTAIGVVFGWYVLYMLVAAGFAAIM